jgi:aspartate-semialdehyde dehydrogenase
MSDTIKVGIIGATGVVGTEIIKCLYKHSFPLSQLVLFASKRSVGNIVKTPYGNIKIELYSTIEAGKMDLVFLAVSESFSRKYAYDISKEPNTPYIIDNSSAFRYNKDIPLIVPEINISAINNSKLIANPNCTTAIAAVVLWPLHKEFKLKRVIISTYQASSGAGALGMEELKISTKLALNNKLHSSEVFTYPLAFNVIPHIDSFQPNNYTREEMKVVWEMRKIFNLPDLLISCTAVRVPTIRAHAETLIIETKKPITTRRAKEILLNSPGVVLKDNSSKNIYPMPISASECENVEVGRIRQSLIFGNHGLEFFICGDQLLKGAALNAVQIAEEIFVKNKVPT